MKKHIIKKFAHASGVLFLILASAHFANAQEWFKNLPSNSTFSEIKKTFYEHYESGQIIPRVGENIYDSDLEKFARWEWFTKSRLDSLGYPMSGAQVVNEFYKFKSKNNFQKSSSAPASWEIVGPETVPADGGGAGRINTMEFDPINPLTIWIGSAGGGVWKTTNGGSAWQNMTPDLPVLSMADIAIHPTNTDTVYIASGDNYGYASNPADFWGGTYSGGIFKSYNGGLTWDTAGLSAQQFQARTILRLIINPANPKILLAATNNGLWRTTDGTASWTKVSNSLFYDLEIRTDNPAVIFASDDDAFFISSDTGATWNFVADLSTGTGRTSIAVTPANPDVIYFLNTNGGFYKSSNGGTSFQPKTHPDGSTTFYGYYDNVLAVSNTDENYVVAGGLDITRSADGGNSWIKITNWSGFPNDNYVHADQKDIQFYPGSGSIFFACNDGGIFKTLNIGAKWYDLSNGLSIAQLYRVSSAFTNPDIVYAGAQDNGIVRKMGSTYTQVRGADGMNVQVDYTDENIVYGAIQYGNIKKSINGGNSFDDVSPSANGDWITPFVFHPTDPDILFAGYAELYKTNDGGSSWNSISDGFSFGNNLTFIAVANSNPDYIYVGNDYGVFRTTDGGVIWKSIKSGLPSSSLLLFSELAVSSENPQKIWMAVSGYVTGKKVYYSNNGGTTWTNYSGTLPNIPVNCIVFQKNSPDLLYIGTDFGVFYRDSTMSDWTVFNDSLPNVNIADLEINYSSEKLNASTYGRGVWQTSLTLDYDNIRKNKNGTEKNYAVFPNPSKGKIFLSHKGSGTEKIKVKIFNSLGANVFEKEFQSAGNSPVEINIPDCAAGVYSMSIETKNNFSFERIVVIK